MRWENVAFKRFADDLGKFARGLASAADVSVENAAQI
jgi:hypothetical protein